MTNTLPANKNSGSEGLSRSIVKTISYRLLIMILDFLSIYWLSGKVRIAFGFTIISNIYTTIGYFFHERIWNKIKWGKVKEHRER